MSVDSWKELWCSQCEGDPKVAFFRAKDLADHKLQVHGPTREQLTWAVEELHSILHDMMSNQFIFTHVKMHDKLMGTRYCEGAAAAVNHKIVQRIVDGS